MQPTYDVKLKKMNASKLVEFREDRQQIPTDFDISQLVKN